MREFRSPFRITPEWVFYIFLAPLPLHVGGVIWAEIRDRAAIASSMFSGRKSLPEKPADV